MKIEPRKGPPKPDQGVTEPTEDVPRLCQVQEEPLLLCFFFVICF